MTSFTNSAVGSGIDYGARSLNATIDEQFRTAATDWNDKDKQGEPVDVSTTGAGLPNDIVPQVELSDIGVDNDAGTFDVAKVLDDSQRENLNNASSSYTGGTSTSDVAASLDAKVRLGDAPDAETVLDFAGFAGAETPVSSESVLGETANLPESVIDIAEDLPEDAPLVASAEPVGGLNALVETPTPIVDLDATKPTVVSEAPIAQDLLTGNLAQDKTAEQPAGGLNAVAPQTAVDKMASSFNFKPTDITKPVVATVGNLLKQTLTQKKKPPPRVAPPRPTGGLQTASAVPAPRKVAPPPSRMDVAKLIPIQKSAQRTATAAPPKTLGKGANLTPITNIAGLTSQVKKTG
jgi:hypothetical protein